MLTVKNTFLAFNILDSLCFNVHTLLFQNTDYLSFCLGGHLVARA